MTTSEEKDIRNYFSNLLEFTLKTDYTTYTISALVFSYLLGMDPENCNNMYVECDWTNEEIDEYNEIESIIHRIINEFD